MIEMPRLPIASLLLCLAANPATAGVLYAKISTVLGTSIVVVDPVTGVTGRTIASVLGPITCAAVEAVPDPDGPKLYFLGGGVVGTVDVHGGLTTVPLSPPVVAENIEFDTSTSLLIARVSTDIVSVSPITGIVTTIAAGAVTQPNLTEGLSVSGVTRMAYVDDGGTIKAIDLSTGNVTPFPAPVGGVIIGARREPSNSVFFGPLQTPAKQFASINPFSGIVTPLSTFTTFQLAGFSVPSTFYDHETNRIAVLAFPNSSGTNFELVEMDLATSSIFHLALAPGVTPLVFGDASAAQLPLFSPRVALALAAALAAYAVVRLRS